MRIVISGFLYNMAIFSTLRGWRAKESPGLGGGEGKVVRVVKVFKVVKGWDAGGVNRSPAEAFDIFAG